MSIEMRNPDLEEALRVNNELLRENLVAAKVANMLSLGRTMNVDATTPTGRAKLARHMELIERDARSGEDE